MQNEKFEIKTPSGLIQWDISAMISNVDWESLKPEKFDILLLKILNPFRGDVLSAMCTNLEFPGIIAELGRGREKLIDGNHRLYKASKLGVEKFMCFSLPQELHQRFIIDFDRDLYDRVIDDVCAINTVIDSRCFLHYR